MNVKKMLVLLGICTALLSVVPQTEAADCGKDCVYVWFVVGYTLVCWPKACGKREMNMDMEMDTPKMVMEPFPNAFASYDKNADRHVSEAEFAATIKDVKGKKKNEEMFGHIDANKDGSITCEEFLEAKLFFGKKKPTC